MAIRRRLGLFPILPVLALIAGIRKFPSMANRKRLLLRHLFERLSGRRLYRRTSRYYGYPFSSNSTKPEYQAKSIPVDSRARPSS